MKLDLILALVAGLAGLPVLFSLLIDILKYFKVVQDGQAGKWSAALNLIGLIGVAIVVNFFPNLNISEVDTQLLEIGKFATLVFVYVIQIFESQGVHALTKQVIPAASLSKRAK